MAAGLCRAFGALLLSAAPHRAWLPAMPRAPPPGPPPCLSGGALGAARRGMGGSAPRCTTDPLWKCRIKYTVRPVGMKKTGGRDHTGRIRVRGIGGGHKRRYRMIDFQRLRYEEGAPPQPFTEKVINVRYDPCRSADIALVAGGNRKRWIIATENMQPGDIIKNSSHIGRMAVSANEGDAYPLGALPVGTLICNLESHPGKGAQYIRAAGAGDLCGHSGPCIQRRPQQAGDRQGRPEPLAWQAPTHRLVASQGWLGRAQDQASPTHEELCQPAAGRSTGVMPGANKAFSTPPLLCYCCLFCVGP
ncbi:large ribosomal subunit protein uL2m isoform X2 [Calonectris borealis]|uniref:large ribosomal subunit protein uL2m isoform X2 n=1 Tax=Calonectris borealis TaxID=1323832 RepID=UPI003F4B2D46